MGRNIVFRSALVLSMVAGLGCGPQEAVIDGSPADDDIDTNEAKIVGGTDTAIAAVPWQIALMDSQLQQFCGGTILNENWVLTAGHCIEGSGAMRVGAGNSKLSTHQQRPGSLGRPGDFLPGFQRP